MSEESFLVKLKPATKAFNRLLLIVLKKPIPRHQQVKCNAEAQAGLIGCLIDESSQIICSFTAAQHLQNNFCHKLSGQDSGRGCVPKTSDGLVN